MLSLSGFNLQDPDIGIAASLVRQILIGLGLLSNAIDNKRVRWCEYRVPAPLTNSATAIEPAI